MIKKTIIEEFLKYNSQESDDTLSGKNKTVMKN